MYRGVGAIASPLLLNYSGIGDSQILAPLRIPVLLDQKLIGKHLSTQYGPHLLWVETAPYSFQVGPLMFLPYQDTARRFQVITFPSGPNRYSLLLWIYYLDRPVLLILQINQIFIALILILSSILNNLILMLSSLVCVYFIQSLLISEPIMPRLTFVTPSEAHYQHHHHHRHDAALFAFVRNPNFTMADHYCGTVSMVLMNL